MGASLASKLLCGAAMKTTTLMLAFSILVAGCHGPNPNSSMGSETNDPNGTKTSPADDPSPSDGGSSEPTSSPSPSPSPLQMMSSPDGPNILSFGTNVGRITAGDSVRFVAVVTLGAGLDHLVGGKLVDAADKINYGAMIASTQGSYQIDLSWAQINQAAPISFATEENRTFVAKFYDQAGNVSTATVLLGVYCNGGLGACNGVCMDLLHDKNNCGSCGNKLADGFICDNGKASCGTETLCNGKCVNTDSDPNNCGGCGVVVKAPAICIWGKPGCDNSGSTIFTPGSTPVTLSYCAANNSCVDFMSDSNNCGSCGNVVAAPLACVAGKASCANVTDTFCAGTNTCSDLGSDINNCGACGRACAAQAGATTICQNTTCEYSFTSTILSTCGSVCLDKKMTCTSGIAEYWSSDAEAYDPPIAIGCDVTPGFADDAGTIFAHTICRCY
jgi:hypothetical protein